MRDVHSIVDGSDAGTTIRQAKVSRGNAGRFHASSSYPELSKGERLPRATLRIGTVLPDGRAGPNKQYEVPKKNPECRRRTAKMQKARRSELSIHYNQFLKRPALSERCR
jgi:hypothetical protein